MAKYHLRFLMSGVPDFLWFEVEEATQSRLGRILELEESERKPFFCFDTTDGFHIVVATAAVQIVNYLWDFRPDPDELAKQFWKKLTDEAYRTDLQLYLQGRAGPLELYSGDPIELRLAVQELEMLLEAGANPFVSFVDEDGETVSIQANQLVMIIVPQTALATLDDLLDEVEQ